MIDLTADDRALLDKVLDANLDYNFLSFDEMDALKGLRDARPESPALEDGIYEVTDESGDYRLRYVHGGRFASYRHSNGIYGYPLPADVSPWRRIDGPPTVTPEQLDAVAREVAGCPESSWGAVSEARKSAHRDYARRILAAAGIEVGK